jgi:hypothetical protein
MKTIVIATLLVMLGTGMASAQYKINKTKYDYKTWAFEEGDPYNPVTCGILSVIPGVGQMVAGEFGRGAAFLGGAVGCYLSSLIGFAVAWGGNEPLGVGLMVVSFAGTAAIDIWSIVDATRVAKVNNLAWRDKTNTGFNLRMEPYISPLQSYESTYAQIGLSLKVNFHLPPD